MSDVDMMFDKAPWRKRTYDFMLKNRFLWTPARKLAHPYSELLGDSGSEMYKLLSKHLPKDKDGRTNFYYGIEDRPEIVMRAVLEGPPKFNIIFGDAFAEVLRLLSADVPLGVFGFDGTWGIREDWWDRHRDILRGIVDQSTKQCRRPIFLLNHTLDRGHEKKMGLMDRIRMHADNVRETFGFKKWKLRESDLLKGIEEVDSKVGYQGYAGGFDIYRSNNKALRMITIRLAFDVRDRCVVVDRG